ncbi:MAG: NigD-like protein [Bacteroidales bacterium]|nr:NigD-like protein [Bacteroidales bacterium]MDY5459960.1 NigD-like protein [Candidatus Cryptobacteroides sp.]MEE0339725.1 NigD-like protein [Bacteroidales bacterium]
MKKTGIILGLALLLTLPVSCLNDRDDYVDVRPTGLVTVYPDEEHGFKMQLDDKTVLYPTNVKTSPYKDKVVRALVNFTEDNSSSTRPGTTKADEQLIKRNVKVNWMDSIRTKTPVKTVGESDKLVYGGEPLEIVKDWVTVAEDGFITLRIRTAVGPFHQPHVINLVSGTNPEDPFDFVLRHDPRGDFGNQLGDGLIAFNLNGMPHEGDEVKVTLNWTSFSGPKKLQFTLKMHKEE